MKALKNFTLIITAALMVIANSSFAQDEIEREITEGKISAAIERETERLDKEIAKKHQRAIALMAIVNERANMRFSDDRDREDAQYASTGFIARFVGISEDRESLERKEIMPDFDTLQNYSKRLDSLIADIEAYLRQ